jgi:DNA-binding MarR family transcriptional regulator
MAARTAPDLDPLALEHQVCYALSVTNRAVLAVYRPLLEPLGLTHPQYLVMLTLWDHHGIQRRASSERREPRKPLSVKEIATTLQLDSATLSPMLKRLAALGLITRTRSATDERSTDVELTESGTVLRQRALKIPPAVIASLGVDITELQHLHEVLTRINSAALAAGALKS